MSLTRRAIPIVGFVAVASLALSACGGSGSSTPSGSSSASGATTGFNAAVSSVVNASEKTGGTLKLGASGDCDSWDSANTYYAWCWDMQRVFNRNLMAYKPAPGAAVAVPDLAAAPGEHDADSKTWTYKLRDGVTWQDGTPITSADVKYGIERLYATDVFATGAGFYYTCILDTCDAAGTPTYKGPYKDPTGDLTTIETPDAKTVVFHLNKSVPSFDYYMALATSSPVKKSADKGAQYTGAVLASGPYKFESYKPGKSVTFVRNTAWSQASDPIRKPMADKITVTVFANQDDMDLRLKSGAIDLIADGGVQQTFQTQILADPTLKANADNPTTGYARYLVVFQTVKPLDNLDCRKAIFYAINKKDLQLARGGTLSGEIASSMTPAGIPGHETPEQYNPYPNGADFTGDLAKAKDELTKCGQPNGFTLNMAYVPGGKADKVLAATQQALARVGITVKPLPGEQATYYSSFIGSPANVISKNIGMAIAAWAPDFPSLNGFYETIESGKSIKASGTSNYASLNDPKVNDAIDKASSTTDAGQLEELGKTINHGVMDNAVNLPFLWDASFYYRNPRLTNIYMNAGTGFYYDYVNIGTSDGK